MPTLYFLEVPPCTLVLLIACRRKSLLLLHPPSRLRLLLLLRESTQSGLEVQSLLLSPPSSRCGSPSRSMMNLALALSTESASKFKQHFKLVYNCLFNKHELSINTFIFSTQRNCYCFSTMQRSIKIYYCKQPCRFFHL